ncbi:hypothetical protein H5T53_06505 [Candidatus Bipolaricaulota bacterium]|nr:hypothetical protein [Candidatus Bipolaricaulota bacterium]
MKWGTSSKVADRVERFIVKALGVRGLYVLLALAAFMLLSGANDKWKP